MKNIIRNTTICLFSIICLSACYDNVDNSIVVDTADDTPILVTTAITGSLVDSNDDQISGYQIAINDLLENVESKRFLVHLEEVNKNGQAIYIKDGTQINSFLHTPLIENDINLIKLQMFDPMNSSLISSSGLGLINISPSISLEIETDNLIDEQGNIPTQDVYADYRDLSTLNNIAQLGIAAYNSKNQLRSTLHLNAFQLEFRDDNDTSYALSNNAKISLQVSNSTEEVSLFHFNEATDKWEELEELEEGLNEITINKSGLFTISEHKAAVYAEGDINKEGTKVSYHLLSIAQQKLYSTAEGKWISIIPSNTEIVLNTLTPCESTISNYTIPASEINIKDIDIEVTAGNYYRLQTTVYDCNGELEETTAIYLKDEINVGNIYLFSDKNLNTWVSVCNSEFDISTYDIDTDIKGPAIPWSLDIVDDQSFLVSCDAFQDGYSYIKIRNDRRVLAPFDAMKIADTSTTLHSTDNKIRFRFEGQMADSYMENQVNVYLEDDMFGSGGYLINCDNTELGCGFTTWNVTHYEAGSEKWVRVSFEGDVWMQTINPPQAGYFPVEGVLLTKATE